MLAKKSFFQRIKDRFGPVKYDRKEFLASKQLGPTRPTPRSTFTQTRGQSTPSAILPERSAPREVPITNRIKDAIAINETGIIPKGNKYTFRQSAGTIDKANEALGKYQVTSEELATYAKRYLGRSISPNDFVKSPTAQEEYMNGKIKRFLGENHTPEQVADIHRRGIKNSSEPGSKIYQDPDYVRKFQRNLYGTLREAAGFNN